MMNFNYYIKYGIRYSLRYILKYIIRLIIFLSIIYLISFLSGKHLFISDVAAKETFYLTPDRANWSDNYNNDFNGNINLTHGYISGAKVHYFNWVANTTKAIINYHVPNSHTGVFDINFMLYSNSWTDDFNPVGIYILQSDHTYPCFVESGSTSIGSSISGPTRMLHSVTCPNVNLSANDFYVGTNTYSGVQNYNPNVMNGLSDVILVSNNDAQKQLEEDKKQTDEIKKQTEEQKKTNDTLKDDNVDSSTNQGSSFFNDFNSGDEGSLTDIVSLPLEYVQHLNDTCKPFTITAGNLGNITIPCLSSIWSSTPFAGVINTASIIINGIICYKLLTSLFLFFKELKDPDDDKVEVMDL